MKQIPLPEYDTALPITERRAEIIDAIRDHAVVIIAGETGSGKTTQIPKMCLEAGRGVNGLIGCTQPRRIAARAMAERVSEELKCTLGEQVGYQVRFIQKMASDGLIKFMTDGILLAQTGRDRDLRQYDTIIIDEAHERSLNIDFLLGYLKTLLIRRPDLRLIITSATIDTQKFSAHFENAPVIEVSGRGYPVSILYQPIGDDEDKQRSDKDLYLAIGKAIRRLDKIDPRGDVLVFLSGERDIREAGEHLSKQGLRHSEVLPLYGRLTHAEQHRIFHPGTGRRIILSTNIAETSLTVPGIQFVIDSGTARVSRYSHRSRIQRLPIEPVSQASANQRAGRCGRLGPGTCIRLYSETDFDLREPFTEPEVLRTSLASVILRMQVMGLGAVEDFPFVDSPAPRMINDGYHLLKELGAINDSRQPTRMGRQMARWPLDVRLARMILEGARLACLQETLTLTAFMSIQDPRERPLDKQAEADRAHQEFTDDHSDFNGILLLWQHLRELRKSLSHNQFRKQCSRLFLNGQRVIEWFDLYRQLGKQAKEEGLRKPTGQTDTDQHATNIHKALLSGLLSHIGQKQPEDRSYLGIRARSFHIFPGSGLFGRSPQWLMCAEVVETSRSWGRINAAIQPDWIEQQGRHLLKKRVFDPHWSRKKGQVLAWEQVSLYGLVIVEKRRVQYAPIDPEKARQVFILEALVRGELDTRAAFQAHNERIRLDVEQMEEKRRKRDVLADENAQEDFFDARIPSTVNSSAAFEQWLKSLGEEGRKQLFLAREVLLREDAGEAPMNLFPEFIELGGHRFELSYRFEPGHPVDGVSLEVPLELLNRLDAGQLEWLVPGMLRDKVVALIQQMSKPIRRALTPPQRFADAALESMMANRDQAMTVVLARALEELSGLKISADELAEDALDLHLRFLVRVIDEQGTELAAGRDLVLIQQQLGDRAQRTFMDSQGDGFNRDGMVEWSVGDLAPSMTTTEGMHAWPALVDQGNAVGLRLFDTGSEAAAAHYEGVLRLLSMNLTDKLRYLGKQHGISQRALLAWGNLGSKEGLLEDLVKCSLAEAAGDLVNVRSEADFARTCDSVRSQLGGVSRKISDSFNRAMAIWLSVKSALDGMETSRPEVWQDVSAQLDDLVYEGFISDIGSSRLAHYERYLLAAEERLQNLKVNPASDTTRMGLIHPWWMRYLERVEEGGIYDEHLDAYRWLIEEYRVSLFAQKLGTAVKVSEKRLSQAWQTVTLP